jgi:hypothetical protein
MDERNHAVYEKTRNKGPTKQSEYAKSAGIERTWNGAEHDELVKWCEREWKEDDRSSKRNSLLATTTIDMVLHLLDFISSSGRVFSISTSFPHYPSSHLSF